MFSEKCAKIAEIYKLKCAFATPPISGVPDRLLVVCKNPELFASLGRARSALDFKEK